MARLDSSSSISNNRIIKTNNMKKGEREIINNYFHKQLKLWHIEEEVTEEAKGVTENAARAFHEKNVDQQE